MRIEFTLTDDDGISYRGFAELRRQKAATSRQGGREPASASSSLPDHILRLRDQGFFHEPQTGNATHEELLKTYHCQIDRVRLALLRLVRRRELRKAVKRVAARRHVAYVW